MAVTKTATDKAAGKTAASEKMAQSSG